MQTYKIAPTVQVYRTSGINESRYIKRSCSVHRPTTTDLTAPWDSSTYWMTDSEYSPIGRCWCGAWAATQIGPTLQDVEEGLVSIEIPQPGTILSVKHGSNNRLLLTSLAEDGHWVPLQYSGRSMFWPPEEALRHIVRLNAWVVEGRGILGWMQ